MAPQEGEILRSWAACEVMESFSSTSLEQPFCRRCSWAVCSDWAFTAGGETKTPLQVLEAHVRALPGGGRGRGAEPPCTSRR